MVGQGLFYENLHKTVREHLKTTNVEKNREQALMLKEQLREVLETYHKCNKYTVGQKRK